MASISIRKLDDSVYEQLCFLAKEERVSMEEEVRRILSRAVAPPKITDVFRAYFGPNNGVDLDLSEHSCSS